MKAYYTGTCHNCGKLIRLGDEIRSDYDNHAEKWKAVDGDCGNLKASD